MSRAIKKRYGRARKYGSVADPHGRKRKLKGWQVYRGYTLDPWKGRKVEHSRSAWSVRVFKGAEKEMAGYEYGASEAEAMKKARALVDALIQGEETMARLRAEGAV